MLQNSLGTSSFGLPHRACSFALPWNIGGQSSVVHDAHCLSSLLNLFLGTFSTGKMADDNL